MKSSRGRTRLEEYMLCIHDAVAVISHAYLEHLPDRGRDLKNDRFYHGLRPYLHDALSFAMAELPEREQACPTFDTLYTLTKKLEVGQPVRMCWYTSSSEMYKEKHRRYPVLAGQVAALEEEGLASTDPVSGEDSESEVDAVDGLNVRLAQAMSHYQREAQKCFMCGSPGHFTRDCPHCDAFKQWHREQANSKGAGESSPPAPRSANTRSEVNIRMVRQIWNQLLEAGGPTSHWIGPETLVDLTVEGRNVNALVDSGSQVNTITPTLVQQYGFPVLPLGDLVDYPLNLMGLGGKHTSLLGFIILRVQEVFLVVPDESVFGRRVPLVIRTCTIGRIINVIWESEMDRLSTLWATARMAQLLFCRRSVAVPPLGGAENRVECASRGPPEGNVDELVAV